MGVKLMNEDLDQLRHARSAKDYTMLKLEDNEYVILTVTRAKIVYFITWIIVIIGLIGLTAMLFYFTGNRFSEATFLNFNKQSRYYLVMTFLILYVVLVLAGYIASAVHRANILFITNQRLIQQSRPTIFANSTNIIELRRVEDVSFRQNGLIEQLLGIGTIRLSTVGDETTYTFRFASSSNERINQISDLIHSVKADDSKQF